MHFIVKVYRLQSWANYQSLNPNIEGKITSEAFTKCARGQFPKQVFIPMALQQIPQMQQIVSIFPASQSLKSKSACKVLGYIFTLCISEFYFGYTLIYLSAIDFNTIITEYSITMEPSVAEGIFQGIIPIGGAIGAFSSALILSRLSRKQCVLFAGALGAILCVLSIIPNYQLFLLIRLLQGFTAGFISAAIPLIVRESTPHQLSNITGSFCNLFIILGLFFLYLYGYVLGSLWGDFSGALTWKIVFLFPIVPIALQTALITLVYPFETPKYLAHNNQLQDLKTVTEFFYKKQHVQEIYEHVLKHHGPAIKEEDDEHRSEDQEMNKGNKGSKTALLFAMYYAVLCPMSGINVMMSYGGSVVSSVAPSLKEIMPAALMFFYLLSSTYSIVLVKRYGRKELTQFGSVGLSICLYTISYAYFIADTQIGLSQFLIVAFLFIYLFVYGVSYAPAMWMWVSDALLPHNIGYAVMVNWSMASVVMIFFPILTTIISSSTIFLIFAVFTTSSLYFISKFMIETKDKYQHQIAAEYQAMDQYYFGKEAPKGKQTIQLTLLDKHHGK